MIFPHKTPPIFERVAASLTQQNAYANPVGAGEQPFQEPIIATRVQRFVRCFFKCLGDHIKPLRARIAEFSVDHNQLRD